MASPSCFRSLRRRSTGQPWFLSGSSAKLSTPRFQWDPVAWSVIIRSSSATTVPPPETSQSKLTIHFIDVGQGNSILVQTPAGKNILVDAGESWAGDDVVSYLKSQGAGRDQP